MRARVQISAVSASSVSLRTCGSTLRLLPKELSHAAGLAGPHGATFLCHVFNQELQTFLQSTEGFCTRWVR